jgi:hypothetical protein
VLGRASTRRSRVDGPLPPSRWVFYAPDRLVAREPDAVRGARAEFVRDADGRVAWFRCGGRIGPRVAGPVP